MRVLTGYVWQTMGIEVIRFIHVDLWIEATRWTGRITERKYNAGSHTRMDRDRRENRQWLWAARFFKTRSLARQASDLGIIECNGQPVKASRDVRVGDRLQVKNEAGVFQLEVVLLSEMRGPAAVRRHLSRDRSRQRVAVKGGGRA